MAVRFRVGVGVLVGFGGGVLYARSSSRPISGPVLPVCCSQELPPSSKALLERLELAAGDSLELNGGARLKGTRVGGGGTAVAAVAPKSLAQAVAVFQACLEPTPDAAAVAIHLQGRNTGLTGGSVPRACSSRPAVIISTENLDAIHLLDGGTKVLCLAGAGIHTLSQRLQTVGRESHTVLGSSFLNPTVAAGLALSSGGTQLRKGPSSTERCLYLRVSASGQMEIIDTLGLRLPDGVSSSIHLLDNLETFGGASALQLDPAFEHLKSSDAKRYALALATEDDAVTRFNADTRGIDPVRSEGKVFILASIHDTFPKPVASETLWISSRDFETCKKLRSICVSEPADLPSSLEYMNRDSVRIIDRAGRCLCQLIETFGIGRLFHAMWNVKGLIESVPLTASVPDKFLYTVNGLFPPVLPEQIRRLTQDFDHHVIVTNDDFNGSKSRLRERIDAFIASAGPEVCQLYQCQGPKEVSRVKTFRFAAAPAFMTLCGASGSQLQPLSLDYSLPKSAGTMVFPLGKYEDKTVYRMLYSHFGCMVVHEDIALKRDPDDDNDDNDDDGTSSLANLVKESMIGMVTGAGGRLPAEHGHGIVYTAPPETMERWRRMDPTNTMNPGIGGMPDGYHYNKRD